MKIVVCVKWVGALGDDVEFADDDRSVDRDYLEYALNEWDSCAIGEAVRLRDEAGGGQVVVVTVGDEETEEALVNGIAMGADRAIRVESEEPELHDPLTVAGMLAAVISSEAPDLVLCGAQSSDAAQGATGPALAALLDFPVATVVTQIQYDSASRKAIVRRELEGGVIDVVEVDGPAVVTIQTGAIEPGYVTMRALQQARRAEIEVADAPTEHFSAYAVRGLHVPTSRRAELIDGSVEHIAARISELVREAAA